MSGFFYMKAPIGIFDSGIGGLSLLPAVKDLLPKENICYVADNAFAPYGNKSTAEVLDRSRKICSHLLEKKAKIIVVACNTITTQVIQQLRKEFPVHFVGIEPAIKPAAKKSPTGKIGVLATEGTLKSESYNANVKKYVQEAHLIEKAGVGLVAHIEEGDTESETLKKLLTDYLQPMLEADIDTLVLGCTHYPFLQPLLKTLLPKEVTIIDNSKAVATQIERILKANDQLNSSSDLGEYRFYSTSKKHAMEKFTHQEVDYLPL